MRLATSGGRPPSLGSKKPGLADALGPEQRGLRQRHGHVLEDLHRVVGGDAGVDHALGAGAGHLLPERAVVGRRLVDAVVALDVQPLLLGGDLDVLAQARAVDLLVVEDVGGAAALVLGQRDQRGALEGVLGEHAHVRALARRVVLVRLPGLRARIVGGDADRGVARADLRHAGLVEDRQRDGRGTGVELADVADRAVVGGRLASVRRRRARLPAARLRGRVVQRLELDVEVADLAAGLLERELRAVDRGHRLRAGGTLQRQARVDRQLPAAAVSAATASLVTATGHQPEADEDPCERC